VELVTGGIRTARAESNLKATSWRTQSTSANTTVEEAPRAETLTEAEEAPTELRVVKPHRITRDKDIWWFDGADAQNYDEEATLTAGVAGATGGTFRWDIIEGDTIAAFENDASGVTKVDTNQVRVKSIGASSTTDDVRVRCSWSHGRKTSTLFHSLTVFAPDDAVTILGPNDTAVTKNFGDCTGKGFRTDYIFEVHDQFGTVIPKQLEINELFVAWVSDFSGEDWSSPTNFIITGPSFTGTPASLPVAQFSDSYRRLRCPGELNPDPVYPTDADAQVKVTHARQTYFAGSLLAGRGRLIRVHRAQWYRGMLRQF
jgi:hypothetical protein